ncbi:MAG: hypothetical protein ABJA78_04220 [Ferruginibacter sp.]
MSFEKNNIDDFFRQKEAAFDPAHNEQNTDWQKLTSLLPAATNYPPKKRWKKVISKRVIKYMGGLALVTTITWVAYNYNTHKRVQSAKQVPAENMNVKNNIVANNNTVSPVTIVKPVVNVFKKSTFKIAPLTIKTVSDTALLDDQKSITAKNKYSAAELYRIISKPAQEFIISNNKANTIRCRQGTELSIPAYIFTDDNGLPLTDSVTIRINEYYGYADMLAAGLTTSSDGQQLVSGGMVYIDATAGGNAVKFRPGWVADLKMPSADPDSSMQLFTATGKLSKDINWKPAAPEQQNAVFIKRSYVGKEKIKLFDFRYDSYDERFGTKSIGQFYVAESNPYADKQIRELIKDRYGLNEEIKLKRITAEDKLRFEKNDAAVYLVKTGPGKADSLMMSFETGLKLKLISTQDSINYAFSRELDSLNFIVKQSEDSLRFVINWRKDSVLHAKQNLLDKNYHFQINNFGWINCDHFLSNAIPKTEFVLNTGNALDDDGYSCNLVFKNYKSILRGYLKDGKFIFSNVPIDQPVQIVAVGMKNGKVFSCIQSLQTGNAVTNTLTFTATTPEIFSKKIASLETAMN